MWIFSGLIWKLLVVKNGGLEVESEGIFQKGTFNVAP